MAEIKIEVYGGYSKAARDLPVDFFAKEFGVEAAPSTLETDSPTKGLSLEGWAVILSIPGAIVATMQLAERLKLIERTAIMLENMRAQLGSAAGVIHVGARHSFDIATAKARDLIEAIAHDDGDEAKK